MLIWLVAYDTYTQHIRGLQKHWLPAFYPDDSANITWLHNKIKVQLQQFITKKKTPKSNMYLK